jgi:hypothetical protein
MKKIIILLLFGITIENYSFPGDHNSLTCDKNYIGLEVKNLPKRISPENNPTVIYSDRAVDEEALAICFREQLPPAIINRVEIAKECRKNIVQAIQLDLLKPFAQSIVKQNIRSRIETYDTETGKA